MKFAIQNKNVLGGLIVSAGLLMTSLLLYKPVRRAQGDFYLDLYRPPYQHCIIFIKISLIK